MPAEILLIEDSLDAAQLIISTLKQVSPRLVVEVAHNDDEAIDFLMCQGDFSYRRPDQLPAMILLNLQLPETNGLEVLRKVKAYSKIRNVPIVMISEHHNSPLVVEGYELGAASCLIRDNDQRKFAENITHIGKKWLKAA